MTVGGCTGGLNAVSTPRCFGGETRAEWGVVDGRRFRGGGTSGGHTIGSKAALGGGVFGGGGGSARGSLVGNGSDSGPGSLVCIAIVD